MNINQQIWMQIQTNIARNGGGSTLDSELIRGIRADTCAIVTNKTRNGQPQSDYKLLTGAENLYVLGYLQNGRLPQKEHVVESASVREQGAMRRVMFISALHYVELESTIVVTSDGQQLTGEALRADMKRKFYTGKLTPTESKILYKWITPKAISMLKNNGFRTEGSNFLQWHTLSKEECRYLIQIFSGIANEVITRYESPVQAQSQDMRYQSN